MRTKRVSTIVTYEDFEAARGGITERQGCVWVECPEQYTADMITAEDIVQDADIRVIDDPQQHRVARDGDRDLAFRGWLLGEGDRSIPGGRYTTVEIYLTEAGAIVTSVEQGTLGEGVGSARAAAHDTPEAALAWLIDDASGELGPASKEAWEAAGETYPPIAEHAVETIA